MPLPIVHSAVGCSIFRIGNQQKSCLLKTLIFVLIANLADLDLIPGILVGKPLLFHKTFGHTFVAAGLYSFAAALLIRARTKCSFPRMFFLSFAVYSSHLVLDFLSSPKTPLFWPLQPIDFERRFFIFNMLPLRPEGVKVFAVGLFSNLHHCRHFWKELLCLSLALSIFLIRFIFRQLSALSKRKIIYTGFHTTYTDGSGTVIYKREFIPEKEVLPSTIR